MKISSIILTFYILLISLYPCCYETGNSNIPANLTEQGTGNHNDTCPDLCSPFFTCGTCTGLSTPPLSTSVSPDLVILENEEFIFCDPLNFGYRTLIWQPPKIS